MFSRTSLDGRPRNFHTFSKVNLKYTKRSFPVGQARCSFHLPHSYNLQILLARANGASTNFEPCHVLVSNRIIYLSLSPSTKNYSSCQIFTSHCLGQEKILFVSCNGLRKNRVGRSVKNFFCIIIFLVKMCVLCMFYVDWEGGKNFRVGIFCIKTC